MNKIILLMIGILLTLPIVMALPSIEINQSSFDIESKAFQSKQIFFEVKNN